MPVPPKLLTSLGSAVHLPCPCLFLEMLQAALPSLSRLVGFLKAEHVFLLQFC